jgi:hypothetical protein
MSALLRIFRLAVVVAAGVGAWFGYEQYAAAQDSVDATEISDVVDAVVGPPAPWADLGLIVADSPWDGPTTASLQPAGDVERQRVTSDPDTGRIQMTLFDPQGDQSGLVEVDPNEVFIKTPGGTWEKPKPDAVLSESVLRGAAAWSQPPTLAELVPEVVWPYAEILADVAGDNAASPTHVLTIRVYGGAFAAAEPALAAQWRRTAVYPDQRGLLDLDVEIDALGHVVAMRNLALDNDVQFRFEPAATAPTFQAPFVD